MNKHYSFLSRRARGALWSVFFAMLCFAAFAADPPYRPVQGDVLTLSTADKAKGAVDPDNGDIYIINMGTLTAAQEYAVTIARPKGTEANYPVSVEYILESGMGNNIFASSLVTNALGDPDDPYDNQFTNNPVTLTFAPGETSKTIYISTYDRDINNLLTNGTGTVYLFFQYAGRTKMEYPVLQLNFTNQDYLITVPPIIDSSGIIKKENVWANGTDEHMIFTTYGNYLFITADYDPHYSEIASDQKLIMQEQYVDHANEDAGISDTDVAFSKAVTLTPRETPGAITRKVTFLHKIAEEAIISDYNGYEKAIPLHIEKMENIKQAGLQAGLLPDDKVTVDISENYRLLMQEIVDLHPRFGTITTNKTEYQGLEQITVYIPVENWKIYSKVTGHIDNLKYLIHLTIDNGANYTDDANKSFDPATGTLSIAFNAPVVNGSADSAIVAEVAVTRLTGNQAKFYPYGAFKEITIKGTTGTPTVFTTSIDVTGIPEGNRIVLENQKYFSLGYTVNPATNCDFPNAVWASSDISIADITPAGVLQAKKTGQVTITLTSEEIAYLKEKGALITSADSARLVKSYTLTVIDSVPKLSITTPIAFYDIADNPSIGFFYRAPLGETWTVKNNQATIRFTHTDNTEVTKTVSMSGSASGSVTNVSVPFGQDGLSAKEFSIQSSGGALTFVCMAVVNLTLVSGGTEYPLEAAAGVVFPPKPVRIESLQKNQTIFYEMESYKAWKAEYAILHLPQTGYTIDYKLIYLHDKNTETPIDGGTYKAGSDPLPAWLSWRGDTAVVTTKDLTVGDDRTYSQSYYVYFDVTAPQGTIHTYFAPMHLGSVNPQLFKMYISSTDGSKTTMEDRSLTQTVSADNRQTSVALNSNVKSYANIGENVLTEIYKEYNKGKKYFSLSYYEDLWGKPKITLSGEGLSEPIEFSSNKFTISYPPDGKKYTLTVHWETAGVTRVYEHTHYGISAISDLYMLKYAIPRPQSDEKIKLTYTLPYQKTFESSFSDELIFCEASPMVGSMSFTSNKNRLPVVLSPSKLQKGLILKGNPSITVPQIVDGHSTDTPESLSAWRNGLAMPPGNVVQLGEVINEVVIRLIDNKGQPVVSNAEVRYAMVEVDGQGNENATGFKGVAKQKSATSNDFVIEHIVDAFNNFNDVSGNQSKSLLVEFAGNNAYNPQVARFDGIHSSLKPNGLDKICYIVLSPTRISLNLNYEHFITASLLVPERADVQSLNDMTKYDLTYMPMNCYTEFSEEYSSVKINEIINGQSVRRDAGIRLNVSLLVDESDRVFKNPLEYLLLVGYKTNREILPLKHQTRKQSETGFKYSYVDVQYDIATFVKKQEMEKPYLISPFDSYIRASLSYIKNTDVDLKKAQNDLKSALKLPIAGGNEGLEVDKIDDRSKSNGMDLKEMGGAFNEFDISIPTTLPVSFNIAKTSDGFYTVKGVVAVNLIPGGPAMDLADNAQDFLSLYNDCMNAVKKSKAQPSNSNAMSSVFAGIRGYLSGVGHVNPTTGKLEVTFGGGGISAEVSGTLVAKNSYLIASVGFSIEAKLTAGMEILNTAPPGSTINIDLMLDTEMLLGLKVWGEVGVDLYIIGATAGLEGGGSVEYTKRTHFRPSSKLMSVGYKLGISAYLKAYAQYKFLWWSGRKETDIFNYYKPFLYPNNNSNPLHDKYYHAATRSVNLMSSTYSPATLGLRSSSLGTLWIPDVSVAAAPRYLLDGGSLAFSHIKTPDDNNDDRLQIHSEGNNVDINPQAASPSFAFDVASSVSNQQQQQAVAAYEQASDRINESDLSASAAIDTEGVMKNMGSKIKVIGSVYNGGSWTADTLSKNAFANVAPRVAQQSDGKASVVWSSGMVEGSFDQYVNGELLLSRYNGSAWSAPISLTGLDKNYILQEYAVAMEGDTTLIAAARHRTGDNGAPSAPEIVFISVAPAPNNKVEVFSGGYKGRDLHLRRTADNTYLLAYVGETSEGKRDVHLMTVNQYGHPTGEAARSTGLGNDHSIQNFKLAAKKNASDKDDLVLLWTEAEQVTAPGSDEFRLETGLYAVRLDSLHKGSGAYYTSYPQKMIAVSGTEYIASYDAQVTANGLGVEAAVTVAPSKESSGANIYKVSASFENKISASAPSYSTNEVVPGADLPVQFGIRNEGYQPISSIKVKIDGTETETTLARALLPGETVGVEGLYKNIPEDIATIPYEISAIFDPEVITRTPSQPVTLSGSSSVAPTVDMGIQLLSNSYDESAITLVLKVDNQSFFPLKTGQKVKVGLYKNAGSNTDADRIGNEVTVDADKLYNTTDGNGNAIVAINAPNVSEITTAYVIAKTLDNSNEEIEDTNEDNNLFPVFLYPNPAIVPPSPPSPGYSDPTVKRIELQSTPGSLTVRLINTGNVATGTLKLTLSGQDAALFALPSATLPGLAVGEETNITLVPGAELTIGSAYTFTLTAGGDGLANVSAEITYTATATDLENIANRQLRGWTSDATLYVTGLTPGQPWGVYALTGATIYFGTATDSKADILLPARGMYIVKSGNKAIKVVY
ncbi:MAG: hypothetical protein LBB84_01560 [Tannerellaceae bacterium]|jgi:hypothetical protein|nr:hypothetical protein [Tannerellaceae bacterium]